MGVEVNRRETSVFNSRRGYVQHASGLEVFQSQCGSAGTSPTRSFVLRVRGSSEAGKQANDPFSSTECIHVAPIASPAFES